MKQNPKVYIVQEPMKSDGKGGLRPMMDFTPALVYGDLEVLIESSRPLLTPAPLIHELKRKLKDFGSDDFLLAVGDPGLIAVATMVASKINHGRVNLLKWDRESRNYLKLSYEV